MTLQAWTDDTPAMSEALVDDGVVDETPQQAAKRIWDGTKKKPVRGGKPEADPIVTMQQFSEWAREDPERMMGVITQSVWDRIVRAFLERGGGAPNASSIGTAFGHKMRRLELARHRAEGNKLRKKIRGQWCAEDWAKSRELDAQAHQRRRERVRNGLKIVQAEVNVVTGSVNLIDKEFGPFAHIKINGLRLPEATSEEALAYCDHAATDVAFIRALCHLIPDPRKPIGEQWTAEMIREAKRGAGG